MHYLRLRLSFDDRLCYFQLGSKSGPVQPPMSQWPREVHAVTERSVRTAVSMTLCFSRAESRSQMIKRRWRPSPLDQFNPKNPNRAKNPHGFPKRSRKTSQLFSQSPREQLMADNSAACKKSQGNTKCLFLVILQYKNGNHLIFSITHCGCILSADWLEDTLSKNGSSGYRCGL